MKKNLILPIPAVLLLCFVVMISCEITDLDGRTSPNDGVSENALNADQVATAIQVGFARFITEFEPEQSEIVRLLTMDGELNKEAFESTRFNDTWEAAYSGDSRYRGVIADVRLLIPYAEGRGLYKHVAIAQFLEAYTIITLVDGFGDIPYVDAIQGLANFNPGPTLGQQVYDSAYALIDRAIVNFTRTDATGSFPPDLYYAASEANWIRACNTLKMKMYVTTRLVDTEAATKFDAIVAEGNYISLPSQDFQFQWGTSNSNPNSRHPRYTLTYTPSGTEGSVYMSTWLMDYMYHGKRDNGNATFNDPDPRMRYYFYRQDNEVPDDATAIQCIAEPKPKHYATTDPYCHINAEGYWGRDHGDDNGIPPDDQRKTNYGVYPVGGKYDEGTFLPITSINMGGNGAGITPMLLSSSVNMMRAEMALVAGDVANAATYMRMGIEQSFSKVRAFGRSTDANADYSIDPPSELDQAYVNEAVELFNAAAPEERMNILGREYFVILFGNGIEAFNFYRRTGSPNDLQPNLDDNPGPFFRSFDYPAVSVNRNNNMTAKGDVNQPVFWDTNMTQLQ